MDINIGDQFECSTLVTNENTARFVGSGSLDVFATPCMIALMENSAAQLLAKSLPEGSASVGTEITVKHLMASPVGIQVSSIATLTNIEGKKFVFDITARTCAGIIGTGVHTRFVVDEEIFMAKVGRQLL